MLAQCQYLSHSSLVSRNNFSPEKCEELESTTHTSFIRLPHHRDNLKSSTIQNHVSSFLTYIYRRSFLGNKMIPDIINHHFTRYWESDDLWVSYPWSQDVRGLTVYFDPVSLFKIIYIFSRVWSVGTYPINAQEFLEWDSQRIPPQFEKLSLSEFSLVMDFRRNGHFF